MSRPFIRPELAARLRPWREFAAAALTFAAGGWLFSLGGLLLRPLGAGVMLVAALWGLGAWRRRRFAATIAAPGLVEIEEGAIRYFGARALGGEIALRDLDQIRLLRLDGSAHWRLRSRTGEALLIPTQAAGAASLADAFAALPGFDLGRAAAALAAKHPFQTVWERRP